MSAAAIWIPEAIGLSDAIALLSEAVTLDRVQRQRRRYERRLRRVLWRMWQMQEARIAAAWLPTLRSHRLLSEAEIPNGLLRLLEGLLASDESDWAKALESVLAEVAILAAREVIRSAGISFTIPTQRIEAEIRDRAGVLVRGLNDTTREELRGILERAVAERLSYSDTARLLRQRFREFGTLVPHRHLRDRAELITVTEVGNAYTRGQVATGNALVDAGIDMEKAWLTAGDERVEAECAENEGAGWIDWEESFPSGHDHPLAHPGCRCALQMQPKGV